MPDLTIAIAKGRLQRPAFETLARAAANLLEVYGSDEQKQRYMQPILDGRYFGTMCLSEPQAGSALTDLTTRAWWPK